MSALAPVPRPRESNGTQRGSPAPAAMCKTQVHNTAKVLRCCRSSKTTHRTNVRVGFRKSFSVKLRLGSLTTRSLVALCCLIAFSLIHVEGTVSCTDRAKKAFKFITGIPGRFKADPDKTADKTWVTFFTKSWVFWSCILLLIGIIIAGTVKGDVEGNLWNDNGASKFLRIGFIVPAVTSLVVALAIGSQRYYKFLNRANDKEYNTWLEGAQPMGANETFVSRMCRQKSSLGMMLVFISMLIFSAVAVGVADFVGQDNPDIALWGKQMFHAVVFMNLIVGVGGVAFLWAKLSLPASQEKEAQAIANQANTPILSSAVTTTGDDDTRRRLGECGTSGHRRLEDILNRL